MSRRWIFWAARVVVTGVLLAVAFVNYQGAGDSSQARSGEVTALLSEPDTVRTPAVVESSETRTLRVKRRGADRTGHVTEGAVRTEDGTVLEFTHEPADLSSPTFVTGDEVVLLSETGDLSGTWVLSSVDGSVNNVASVLNPPGRGGWLAFLDLSVLQQNEQVALGAVVITGLLLLGSLRSFPRVRSEASVPTGDVDPTSV